MCTNVGMDVRTHACALMAAVVPIPTPASHHRGLYHANIGMPLSCTNARVKANSRRACHKLPQIDRTMEHVTHSETHGVEDQGVVYVRALSHSLALACARVCVRARAHVHARACACARMCARMWLVWHIATDQMGWPHHLGR